MKIIMTFRQVVLQQLWNFELLLFRPGAIRNMEELQDPRKVCYASSVYGQSNLYFKKKRNQNSGYLKIIAKVVFESISSSIDFSTHVIIYVGFF